MIGQVTGADVSVTGPSQEISGSGVHSFQFAAGSTVVVHSGQARVDFTGGGELDICGPAKFTVLASGEALTIALSFGRIHAKLDASRPVTIYTPLITATPLAVMSEPRDITFGIEPNTGAMCVLAAHGALQMQQQLSGETLIVPEPSEVALRASPLSTTPAAGSCRCEFDEVSAKVAPPPASVVAQKTIHVEMLSRPSANSPAQVPPSASATVTAPPPAAEVPKALEKPEMSAAPAPTPAKPRATVPPPPLPPANGPILKIIAPPLLFEAKPPDAPGGTISVAALLLAKAVIIEPVWTLHGTVAEPARTARNAKGTQSAPKQESNKKQKRKGFWGWFHRFLFGSPDKTT